ncbi:hypothetical protein [Candidatus Arsenophonus triatominarum]|uniref:hypothetical protein n=1 Tax=Candidatus Arsenophonus triatominarum TaxID=57911 RepID=UPI0007C49ED8|nr:hypothetical protein [Candidatus Arsenophonus triatominarum]
MARARNIKPGFFSNDDLAECEPLARLLFAGLWTIADREGRLEDKPRKIKAMVLPYDEADCEKLLSQLHSKNFITRYSVDGNDYIQINNWKKHQNPHCKESPSEIPEQITQFIDNKAASEKHHTNTVQESDKHLKPKTQQTNEQNLNTSHVGYNQSTLTSKQDEQPNNLSPTVVQEHDELFQTTEKQDKKEECRTSTVQAPYKHSFNPADSLNLIPDSLNLIPYNTQAEKMACEDEGEEISADVHSMSEKYAFEGKVIRLNHKDFADWQKLYPNLDLPSELLRLDIEYQHDKPKKWFITTSQKLNYQNKQAVRNPVRKVSGMVTNFSHFDYGQTEIPSWAEV